MNAGTQDIGTGTRTIVAIVTAEILGLEVVDITVGIGNSDYPYSGSSGGSTTVPSVCPAVRVTAGLALLVFLLTIGISLRSHGVWGFFKKFMPSGLPWWIGFIIDPIEIVSWLAKPVSLAVRLFANMMVGHALILVFVGMAAAGAWYVKALPLAGAVVMSGFELFVSFIQAFIFTMLAGFYIKEALEAH